LNPFKKFTQHGIDWDKYNLWAYNCGVVGFSDMELKDKYANTVKRILFDLSNDGNFEFNRKKYDGMFLIAEQSMLYYTLKENQAKTFEVLPTRDIMNSNGNWLKLGNDIGYCHMWARTKYKESTINKIKYKIEKFFPEYAYIIKYHEQRVSDENKVLI
jgi:hypothetical protein